MIGLRNALEGDQRYMIHGEPADYAEPGMRAGQAMRAAAILGADRLILDHQDRFIQDTILLRLELAGLTRKCSKPTAHCWSMT